MFCDYEHTQLKYLKWAAGLLLVFTIVLLGAIAGLTAGIVIANKDTKSSVSSGSPSGWRCAAFIADACMPLRLAHPEW